jgi:hypothetical protein
MSEPTIDWDAYDAAVAKLERDHPGVKFFDGVECPLHKWAGEVAAQIEAELAAMTPEQREAERLAAIARLAGQDSNQAA